ncbi:MAG: Beta-barrel assembly machine subunit BamB [Planctomycetaceae bacterium]|nr:Beta-barrel assembly machine subunit BamB [Planctomycetaceae bacterium]
MVDLSARSGRYFCWIIAACLSLNVGNLPAQAPKLAVSSFPLDNITLTPPTTKEFAAQLAGETWCKAVAAETKATWNHVPAGVDRSQWVSLVSVGFKGQADAYAFMFDGPNGSMSMAIHIPFREVWLPGGVAAWIWPTDSVLGALRVGYQDHLQQKSNGTMLKLTVIPWESAAADTVATNKTSNLDDAQTLAPALVLPSVEVMAHAAAFEAGWVPTTTAEGAASDSAGAALSSAICEVKVEDQACSFRLKIRDGEKEYVLTKLHVPWETYHEHLVRLFRYAKRDRGVSDFSQIARHPVELLALHDGKVACLLNHELAVFDLANGKKTWTTEPTVKPPGYLPVPQYTPLQNEKGTARLVRYRPALAEFNWESGKITPLAPAGADVRHRFSTTATGDFATSNAGTVSLLRQSKLVWEQKEPDAVSAGPLLIGTDVVYGQATGRLVARSAKDSKVRWESRLPRSLYGMIVPAGESLLVFSNTAEALVAVDAATGKEHWRCPVGDVLLESPLIVGKQVLLATKGNRLLLVDLKSGKVQNELQWPTWLVSVSLINSRPEPLLVCSDLAGTVTLLSPTDLKPTRTILVGAQLTGPLLYADKLSYTWPVPQAAESEENLLAEIKSGPTQAGPVLLAADVQGFIYILPLSSPE